MKRLIAIALVARPEHLRPLRHAVVLTSRVSVEMVQKTATIGAGIIIAVSAPTALAIRTAKACGITLVGIARGRDFEVFSHPAGIAEEPERGRDETWHAC